ncbi:integrase [Sphingobium xanthum]|uniref:tyrosine-type recombinase/integrase n=1 Tax=Sphingobium xanthum TaxID=1387165 RepID=UPI001C8BBDF1|nr:integrase arm-type DNA-binding domain-containing protein [Sphingobium xanthum]
MALSALAASKAKPREKQYKLSDSHGLYLLVTPDGGKYWRYNYRFDGKHKTLALGVFPEVGLSEARERHRDARSALTIGLDPLFERKYKLRAQLGNMSTFEAVAQEWLAKREREGLSDVTLDKIKWLLSFAYPTLGKRRIGSIEATELLLVLRRVEAGGRYESARRLRSVFGRVFRYAVATGRAQIDPAQGLKDALTTPKVKHRAAITDEHEVGPLLQAIDDFSGHQVTRLALRIAPHVFVRPGELRHAEWQEIDFDRAIWSISADKMKMRRPHRVPLSRQALALFEEAREFSGYGRYVFPGVHLGTRPMSENTLNLALRKLGYSGAQMTSHGFRAMASTLLNEMGKWHPDAIERQLAHIELNGVRRAYARGEFWDERVRMMQCWSDYLDELRDEVNGSGRGANR